MEKLEIKGSDLLNENERFELNKLIQEYDDKVKRKTRSEYTLKIAVKKYSKKSGDKGDSRAKYSLSGIVKGQTSTFEASSADWVLNRAVHKLFSKLMTEIEHAYHSSEQSGAGRRH